jgi:hypothetical protein
MALLEMPTTMICRPILSSLFVVLLVVPAARGQATRPSLTAPPPSLTAPPPSQTTPPPATRPAAESRGLRVFTAGHSFHVPMAGILTQMAKSAGLDEHRQGGPQSIGGSTVSQHWALPDAKDKARKAIAAGDVDVLTLSPYFQIPDDAIDKYVDLLLTHNPAGRVTVQASWVPRDGRMLDPSFKNAQRDAADLAVIRKLGDGYADLLRKQVTATNDRWAAKAGRPVIFIVPVGEAVTRLRERVAKGEVPGIAKQADLFRDELGHGKEPLYVLVAYCHYAVIYGRSPVGLPVPDALAKAKLGENAEAVNRVLQTIAWEAAVAEPASGVTAAAAR